MNRSRSDHAPHDPTELGVCRRCGAGQDGRPCLGAPRVIDAHAAGLEERRRRRLTIAFGVLLLALGGAASIACRSTVPLLGAVWVRVVVGLRRRAGLHVEVAVALSVLGLALLMPVRVLEYGPGASVFDPLFATLVLWTAPVVILAVAVGVVIGLDQRRPGGAFLCALSLPIGWCVSGSIVSRLTTILGVHFK